MKKIKYLLHQTFMKMKYEKKRYILYVFSFYVGLLLPAFCIANIRSVDQVIYYTTFENMKETVQIDWFSRQFDVLELDKNESCSVSAFYEEDFAQWDHQYIPINGIDEFDFYPPLDVKGRTFTKSELQKGEYVCLLNQRCAEEHSCKIGDKIQIRGTQFEMIGIIENTIYPGMIIPYQAMKEVYQQEENIQFKGIFLAGDDVQKERVIRDITGQLEDNAELIDVVDGEYLYTDAYRTKRQWHLLREAVAVVAILFFLFNETIVLKAKAEKERKAIGVNMALGATERDIRFSLFFETFLITIAAVFIVVITLLPLAKFVSLDHIVILDGMVILEILIVAIVVCEILTELIMREIKKGKISVMIKTTRDE